MVRLHSTDGPLGTAKELAGYGFNVLPARYKDKSPLIPWTKYQKQRTDSLLSSWFGGTQQRNFWIMTGQMSGIIVVDCDNEAGATWWEDRLGTVTMESTARVKTRKGYHYYFRIPEAYIGQVIPSWSVHPGEDDNFEESFDVRADGTGVIAAGSVHESGHVYRWVLPDGEDDPRACMLPAPEQLLDGSLRREAPRGGGGSGEGTRKSASGQTRSMLSSLLSNPPSGEGSGRNDWLARVAGHYAKTYHAQEDLYLSHCHAANQMMGEPLGKKEYTKTIESVWKGEHERHPQRALDADCGWLRDGGWIILTQIVNQDKEGNKEYGVDTYSNFNIKAKGVMVDEQGQRTYWVELMVRRPGGSTDKIDTVLPAVVSGDERKLRVWLAGFGVSVLPPDNMWPRSGPSNLRLQRYLESQQPPVVHIASTLGWDAAILNGAGGFVTHDGVITADRLIEVDSCGVRANPALQAGGLAPHVYGFENDEVEAKRVLREVMTFHDDTITAVFGSWWAACLLKPQIEEYSSLFPFVAIEATSESGKTNGFFDMMVQMNGNTRGETQSTKAALRDMAASHKSGIVWIDDMDDPANLMELLRAATSGGTLSKMGEDRMTIKNAKIVSPIVISGEQLGMSTQKALIDRAIPVNATSPTGRKSLHDPTRPQWDDILEVRERYPEGLSVLAGWFVQDALRVVDQVLVELKKGRRGVAGRAADKIAVLRAGAKLLDYLVAENPERYVWEEGGLYTKRVEDYLNKNQVAETAKYDNALTLKVLPWALRNWDFATGPSNRRHHGDVHTPAFVRSRTGAPVSVQESLTSEEDFDLEVWFSIPFLAEAWSKSKHGREDKRTESEGALKQQADAIQGMGAGRQWKIKNAGGSRSFYRVIRGPMARTILERAEGTH